MISIGTNSTAQGLSFRMPYASLSYWPSWLKFTTNSITAATDPETQDIGRAMVGSSLGATHVVRVRHTATGLQAHSWSADPSSSSHTVHNEPATTLYADHSLGAYLAHGGGNWTLYATRSTAANTIDIYRRTEATSWAIHRSLVLPADVVNGFTACALVSSTQMVLYNIPTGGEYGVLWVGNFDSATFAGTLVWNAIAFALFAPSSLSTELTDHFSPTPDEPFTRQNANAFDAVLLADNSIVMICQDHHRGRTQIIKRMGDGIYTSPVSMVPMDFVDEDSRVMVCRMVVIDGVIHATGRMSRSDTSSNTITSTFDCLLRSTDGMIWGTGKDMYIGDTALYGQLLFHPGTERYHYISFNGRMATESHAVQSITPYRLTVDRGAESTPSASADIANPGTYPWVDENIDIYLNYDDHDPVLMGSFGLDRPTVYESAHEEVRALSMRERNGKKLTDWTAPYTLDVWSSTRKGTDFLSQGDYYTVQGSPTPSIKNLTLAEAWTGGSTVVLEADDGEAPAVAGDLLRYRVDGDVMYALRLTGEYTSDGGGEGPFTYPCVGIITLDSLPAGSIMVCDEVFLGRDQDEPSEINIVMSRRLKSQIVEYTLRFSPHSYLYGEYAEIRFHAANRTNFHFYRLTKIDGGGGATHLRWDAGFETDDGVTATRVISFTNVYAVSAINLTLFVRMIHYQGNIREYLSTTEGAFPTLQTSYSQMDAFSPDEGTVGFSGFTSPSSSAVTAALETVVSGLDNGTRLPIDAVPVGFPASGHIRVGASTLQYSSYTTTAQTFTRLVQINGDGSWDVSDPGAWPDSGFATMFVKAEIWNGGVETGSPDDVRFGVTYNDVANKIFVSPNPNDSWALPLATAYSQYVKFTLYPTFTIVDERWGAFSASQAIYLAPGPTEVPLGTALDYVLVSDAEPDMTVADAAMQVAARANVTLEPDLIPNSNFPAVANWTVSFAGERLYPTLTTLGAYSYASLFQFVDAVMSFDVTLGNGEVKFEMGTDDAIIKFASTGIQFWYAGVKRSEFLYFRDVNGQAVRARISVYDQYIGVWLSGHISAVFANPQLASKVKTLHFASYSAMSFASIEIFEAYERVESYLIDQGESAAQALSQVIGERRLHILYRAQRNPRLTSYATREALGALQSSVESRVSEKDDPVIRTISQVRGAFHIAERMLNPADYGARFILVQNGDLLTQDSCDREALAVLRETQEKSLRATASGRADLRVENEDTFLLTVEEEAGTWIVDSSTFDYEVAEDNAILDMTVGARKYVP